MKKPIRAQSGVTVVTLLTKPFRCPGRCIYCPNDPTMPKSYLQKELKDNSHLSPHKNGESNVLTRQMHVERFALGNITPQ